MHRKAKETKRYEKKCNEPKPKKGAEPYLSASGTGIPCTDKRAHARVVSQSTYHL